MSQASVVRLNAIRNISETAVGPKAMSLIKLRRMGLAVPAGFCITGGAFREHLERNNLSARVKSAVDEPAKAGPAAKKSALSDLREAIIEAPLADSVRDEIKNHFRALGADFVAVRSSATAEDLPGHSFAGQYDTYLGVIDLAGCVNAVKKCWASLWTERAYDYRRKNGIDQFGVSMAVIVQSLVPADASGVLFTADPVTGQSGNIVIEACFGLGQALVSGKVMPDRFVVDKKKLRLLFRAISEKKIECAADRAGTVKERALSSERAIAWSLGKRQIKRLAKLAKKVEAEFGCPQDIEWAVCKKKIYLLQSRPITAIPQERSWEDRQIWCSNPVKEVMPDVVTPITASTLLGAMADEFFEPLFGMLCIERGDHPIYSFIAGRIYFNANIWGAIFRCVPGGSSLDLTESTGGHKGFREVVERLQTAADEDLPDIKFSRVRFILKIPIIIIGTLFNTPRKGRQILAKIGAKNEQWSRLDPASLSSEQITQCLRDILLDFRALLGNMPYLFGILAALPAFYILCTRWFSEGGSCAGKLLAGLGDMDDAVAGLDLWRLAAAADTTPRVKDLILSDCNWHSLQDKLAQTNTGKDFLEVWNKFMARHGHHCRAELELYNRRWFETPDYILRLVRTYIGQIGEIDPVKEHGKRAHERRQLERQCRQRLKNPLKRIVFNRLLRRAQEGSIFRENVKSEVIRLITTLRKMLVELGRRLADNGVLKNQDDIFFFRLDEIEPAVEGKVKLDIRQVIAGRRAEYDKNRSITPPDVVFGKFDPDEYIPDVEDKDIEVLDGLAVSPGVVTGKARVILRADTDEQVLAGEILVAPFTDPGWTPYFVTATAVVMDQGGILSHGSIVAREYGIPAVVNVGSATRILKTGHTLQVDGNRGVVRILK